MSGDLPKKFIVTVALRVGKRFVDFAAVANGRSDVGKVRQKGSTYKGSTEFDGEIGTKLKVELSGAAVRELFFLIPPSITFGVRKYVIVMLENFLCRAPKHSKYAGSTQLCCSSELRVGLLTAKVSQPENHE